MKILYTLKSILSTCFILTVLLVHAQPSSIYFDLDACNAILTGAHQDYSEFTGDIVNSSCANLSVQGGHLYRNNPTVNAHSCTPGVNDQPAMCIGSNSACTFTPNSDQALRFDILVTPGSDGPATLSELSFYEKGPSQFVWINGASGPNNYPTLFGLRILKNGTEIFVSTEIATELSWNLNTFNFSGAEFTVSESTVFNFEILPYCPIGNGEPVSAWDIDEINLVVVCCDEPEGGEMSGGPFAFCVGDGIPDNATGVTVTGQTGPNNQWVITDNVNTIIGLPSSPEFFDFENSSGTNFIWNISYEDGLTGLIVGNNLFTGLTGCFGISDSIMVLLNQPEGGSLTGGPFEFCSSDTVTDVTEIVLAGNAGPYSQWVVINDMNTILNLPGSLDEINFEGSGAGTFFIVNVSFFDTLSGLVVGNNLPNDVVGCFSLSNSVTIVINQPEGGLLTGGPFEFCVGDSIPDYVTGVSLTGNVGTSQWVITNETNMILSLPASLDSVNFDGAGTGICLIWNISYFGTISGLVPGNNLLTDVEGCFDLSNSITVNRNQPEGGNLIGGPFEFCSGDSITDVTSIILSGNVGQTSQWVVTNDLSIIMSLPGSLSEINLGGNNPGVFLIYNISYFDTLSGLVVGNNLLEEITGCADISDSIIVVLTQPEGGTIIGGPFEFCVGDGTPDHVSGIVLNGDSGENSQWVISDESNNIIGLPALPDNFDFDAGDPGTFLIWHLSYDNDITGLVIGNNLLEDVFGCFGISNAIAVIRNQPEGGELTGGPFEFCVGDSIPDYISGIVLTGNVGSTSQWVITNDSNLILSLPESLDSVDFDGGGPGICLIWNISYFDTISGLAPGNNLLSDIDGCFDLSNSITVNRNQPEGGNLIGGPFEFCAGDSATDVTSIILNGNVGSNSQFVVTNDNNIITGLPGSLNEIDFGGNDPGVFFIWNISYFDTLSGLELGNNLFEDVTGCVGISDSVIIVLSQPDGGELTGGPFEFCVGDTLPDIVSGIDLSGQTGSNSQWVITSEDNIILSLPISPDSVNFDDYGPGTFLIWHVSYDNISGLEEGNDLLEDLVGCFGISNSIAVIRNQPIGGELIGGPFEFCVGDSIMDVSEIILSGNVGDHSQWIVINDESDIMMLPDSLEQIDFTGSGPGTFVILNISYFDTLSGLEIGNNLFEDVNGCFAISDSITVTLNQPLGGELIGGPFEFCVGDTIPDHVSGIELIGNVGANSQYVITDSLNNILSLPLSPEDVDFNNGEPGLWFIWHVSYDGVLIGLDTANNLLTDLEGCFSLSNAIAVIRLDCGDLHGDPVFELKINPNPARDFLTIEILYNGEDTPVAELFDASGRVCLKQTLDSFNNTSIPTNHLADGYYLVRIKTSVGYRIQKVLIIR